MLIGIEMPNADLAKNVVCGFIPTTWQILNKR